MTRVKLGAAVAAVVLGGLPAVAAAAPAAPAPLTGENLSVTESSQGPNFPFFLPCGNYPSTDPHFQLLGTATGPYFGAFDEWGTAKYLADCNAPPTIVEPLNSYTAHFRILTATAAVTGTESMVGSAVTTIWDALGGGGVAVGPVTTHYAATITTAYRSCTDVGTSTATLGQSFGARWYGVIEDGPFASHHMVCQPLT